MADFERHRAELIRARSWRTILGVALFLVALAFSVDFTRFYPDRLGPGLPRIGEYFALTLPTLHWRELFAGVKTEGSLAYWYFNLATYLRLLFQTVNMALLATLLGFVGGLILAFPASRNMAPSRLIAVVARRVTEVQRAVPEIVFALVLVYAFGIGPLAGIVAIAIHQAGVMGKLFSEVVENASMRPVEGVRSAGGGWLQEVRFGILPQVLPNFLAYGLWRLEVAIRSSAIIGFVGGGGIGQELYLVIVRNYYGEVSAMVLLIILTVTVIDVCSSRLRRLAIGRDQLG